MDLNVTALQFYRIERQFGNHRSVRSFHLQTELIVISIAMSMVMSMSSGIALVSDCDGERIVPRPIELRLSGENSRISDYRERLYRGAPDLLIAVTAIATFDIFKFALQVAVPLELDVELEGTNLAVVEDGSVAVRFAAVTVPSCLVPVTVTIVVPIGNNEPEGGSLVTTPQLPVKVGAG
jgi:hypothetical protein